MPEQELPIRIIRERGRVRRATYAQEHKERRITEGLTQSAKRGTITHRTDEQIRQRREEVVNRAAIRRNITEESLRRRRIAYAEQAREQFGADVLQRTGTRPAAVSFTSGLIRVFVVIFLLSMLFLVVSRGQATGNAIQKVGYFLNNLTSGQPLFKKVSNG